MRIYIPQTSASDRYEAAREALEIWDSGTWPNAHAALVLAEALRGIITPPGVNESEEQIAGGIHARYLRAEFDGDFRYSGEPMRNALTAAVRAGIQSAHESWEPEVALRPTQEQMLRWLGVRHGDPSRGTIVIPHQYIERED